jgi:hypothetical protein
MRLADGRDAYAYAKRIGVYKQIKRTEGVSTTDIVGRMLLMTREHHLPVRKTSETTIKMPRRHVCVLFETQAPPSHAGSDGESTATGPTSAAVLGVVKDRTSTLRLFRRPCAVLHSLMQIFRLPAFFHALLGGTGS